MTSAVVVARGGSRRLPRKALLGFAGSTLIGHKVRELRRCCSVDRIYVGSDSDEILAEAEAHGAIAVLRDSYHTDEARCTANEMIADMARKVDGDLLVWAHPTNPLVRPSTYDAAVTWYYAALEEGYDSLASVTRIQRHAWVGDRPLNFDPWGPRHELASELPPIAFQDGAIFIQTRDRFLHTRYFYGRRPVLFPIPEPEGLDVDTAADLDIARRLWEGDYASSAVLQL